MTLPALPEAAKTLARREAQQILEELSGVRSVVVATIDGFDLASASHDPADAARIAATASSIAAIGAVVSQETLNARSRSIIIDTEAGFAVIFNVHRHDIELVINVVADRNAVLGQVNYRVGRFAQALAAV